MVNYAMLREGLSINSEISSNIAYRSAEHRSRGGEPGNSAFKGIISRDGLPRVQALLCNAAFILIVSKEQNRRLHIS